MLSFAKRTRNVSQKNYLRDIAFTNVAALMMDSSDSRRRFLFACIHRIACRRPRLVSRTPASQAEVLGHCHPAPLGDAAISEVSKLHRLRALDERRRVRRILGDVA